MPQVALVAVAAVAAVGSYVEQRNAAKSQAKAYAAQQRQADIANARERRSTIQSARIAAASVEAQGVATGMFGGSAQTSSLFNIRNQLGQNLSFLDQNQQLSDEASRANAAAAAYSSRAQGFSDLSSLAMKGANVYG